jgi:asparagine synthase (glutamine-hydrolysing)
VCGIAGILDLSNNDIPNISGCLLAMDKLIVHRGPDDNDIWVNENSSFGLVHRRLSIIDLSNHAKQPMHGDNGTVIAFNGEIYNYKDIKTNLNFKWNFKSNSDTECILAAYEAYGEDFLSHLRGMFAFALWDKKQNSLFCARDRFGIKPFYYAVVNNSFIFASEAKALLPFLPSVETEKNAFSEYIVFNNTIGEQTLFKGIKQLLPGHAITVANGKVNVFRYWDINFDIDFEHSEIYFENKLKELLAESLDLHLVSDVPVGSYLSGGVDSSLITMLTAKHRGEGIDSFHGKFTEYPGYDESSYAREAANKSNGRLHEIEITSEDFKNNIQKVIYHLDFPVAGPGSFPQYMTSKLASEHVKVVLGGQGGDEIFGGYTRYLLAYFEQCIKAAVEGNYRNGNYVVTIESIIPNLGVFREYKPMIKEFWKEGLFEDLDDRYFRLIDRSGDMKDEVNFEEFNKNEIVKRFKEIFNNKNNVKKSAYFDKMTHFDFKCLLPGLLHVEDRMSMAHGLESRVPFLDHPLAEFLATIPADVKFKNGRLKHMLLNTYKNVLPSKIYERRDKMGFPVPLKEWFKTDLKDFVHDVFRNQNTLSRDLVNIKPFLDNFEKTGQFSRKFWVMFSLELWHQTFHDKAQDYRNMIK